MYTLINTMIVRFVLLVAGCLVASTVNAVSIDSSVIQRMNLDGSGLTTLVRGLPVGLDGIALDVKSGQMYWTTRRGGKIQRANLDGSGVADLVTTRGSKYSIALDVGGGQIYWAGEEGIQRANLDGSGVTDLVTGGAHSIALDVGGGRFTGQTVKRSSGQTLMALE